MTPNIIIERDVMVQMRDGVKLATDIYRPDDGQKHPVLVNGHPYDNDGFLTTHELVFSPLVAAQKGYAVVVQEARGRYGSEGTWRPFGLEGKDAYDTVEWAAAQSWSNGNVGLYGACAGGWSAIQGAVEAPPHLKAVFAYMTATNHHNGWTYSNGAFELGFQMSWTWMALASETIPHLKLEPAAQAEALRKLTEAMNDGSWKSGSYLPLIDFPAFQGGAAPYWREWLSHPSHDAFWQGCDAVARAQNINVPVLHMSAWYDTCLRGHLDLHAAMQRGNPQVRDKHRFLLGPWDHSAYYNKRPTCAGQRDFGPGAMTGPDALAPVVFQWFNYWLKGEGKGFLPENKVRYYQMGEGENAWKDTDTWPPAHTIVPYYMHSAGQANTRSGDGVLDTKLPGRQPADSYIYDPLDPVPTRGGRSMVAVLPGVEDQAEVEERQDVLVYTTPRLAEPLVLNGPMSVTLFASSSAPDTDFTAKLVDVEPGGYCAIIADAIVRARYRNGCDHEEFLEPGKVTEFQIDLWDIAHTFQPNHRIRLEISSSNFPRFDRNLNSRVTPALGHANDIQKATQQIFHNAQYPSCLNLPVAS